MKKAPNSPIVNLAEEVVNTVKEEVKSILDGKFQEGCIDGRKLNRKLITSSTRPDCTWSRNCLSTDDPHTHSPQLFASADNMWIPQAGDSIVYNRDLHEAFVALHADSLFYHQRSLLSFSDTSTAMHKLIPGRIAEVRYVLPPKSPMLSFGKEKSPLFELTIRFFDNQGNRTIFWRPCFLKPKIGVRCSCGSSSELSFVMPLWLVGKDNEDVVPKGLSEDYQNDAILSMVLFREQCLKGRSLILDNDKAVLPEDSEDKENHDHNTRVADKRLRESFIMSNDSDAFLTAVASPDICIEMIFNRLRNGYYRQEEAIIDDINGSFLAMSCYFLRDRREYLLPMLDNMIKSYEVDNNLNKELSEEDLGLLHNLNQIRQVHAIAFLSVSDPKMVSEVYTLEKTTKPIDEGYDDQEEISVLKSLPIEEILHALQPDGGNYHATIPINAPNPTVRVIVKVAGGLPSKKETIHVPIDSSDLCEIQEIVIDYSLPLFIEPHIYQLNDRLCAALYGSHEKRYPCARCQVRGHNFLVCRVRK